MRPRIGPCPRSRRQGFALFTSPAAARFAVDLVTGSEFDEASTLRAELARKNMFVKVCRTPQTGRGAGGA